MKDFAVWHKKNPDFLDAGKRLDLRDFDRVAFVFRVESIEDAFRLTNHIDKSWYLNDNVLVEKESRSSSVGDLFYEVHSDKWYHCEMIGWKEFRRDELAWEERIFQLEEVIS